MYPFIKSEPVAVGDLFEEVIYNDNDSKYNDNFKNILPGVILFFG